MSRRVVETLRQMPERRRFLRGMVAWVGYEQVPIEYRRAGRASGRGASYHELFRLAVEALAAFSDVPLALAAYFGIIVAASAGLAAAVLCRVRVAGWLAASVGVWMLVWVLFLGGVQLISVGILGRYVARMHEQTLQRPLYLVSRVVDSPLDARLSRGSGTGRRELADALSGAPGAASPASPARESSSQASAFSGSGRTARAGADGPVRAPGAAEHLRQEQRAALPGVTRPGLRREVLGARDVGGRRRGWRKPRLNSSSSARAPVVAHRQEGDRRRGDHHDRARSITGRGCGPCASSRA